MKAVQPLHNPARRQLVLPGILPTCARCGRPFSPQPWPLERGDRCSPSRWFYCIRPVAA